MSLPRMSLHIGDYKKDTGHLRAAGHGAYFLLMMHYWATGSIPKDDQQLASIACMTDEEWKYWGPIVKAFFKKRGLRHKRIDTELAVAQAKYERRVAAGSKGGKAKAKAKPRSSNARALPKQPITLTDNPKANEQERARASEGKSDAMLDRLIEAAGGNVVHGAIGIEVIRPIIDLVSMGCDFDADILPAVREKVAVLPEPLRTWGAGFLRDAVLAKQASRLRGRGASKPKETDWNYWAAQWAKDRARGEANWPMPLQPNPGEPGCRCPPEILMKHGIDPSTGNLAKPKQEPNAA